MLNKLISIIYVKDQYLLGHSQNVAYYAEKIAKYMKLSSEKVKDIYYAALLHDIGKIGVAENILNKESSLSSKEWHIIKKHPIIGADIIGQIKQYQQIVPYIFFIINITMVGDILR